MVEGKFGSQRNVPLVRSIVVKCHNSLCLMWVEYTHKFSLLMKIVVSRVSITYRPGFGPRSSGYSGDKKAAVAQRRPFFVVDEEDGESVTIRLLDSSSGTTDFPSLNLELLSSSSRDLSPS